MTGQPRTPGKPSVIRTPTGHIHLTWTSPNPRPYTGITYRRRGKCEECAQESLWALLGEPLLCRHHTDLAAYAALPWWRRAITRKPRP